MIAWTDIAVCILARCVRWGEKGLLARETRGRSRQLNVLPQGTTIRPLLQGVPS